MVRPCCYARSMSGAPVPNSSDPSESTPHTPTTDGPSSPSEPRTIPQRELRNDSSRILREVEQGAEFIITNRGRPVARLTGLVDAHHSRLSFTPPSKPLNLDEIKRVRLPVSTQQILDELREERM